jgi:eukaryotic-like serine/threonine-protein kinase
MGLTWGWRAALGSRTLGVMVSAESSCLDEQAVAGLVRGSLSDVQRASVEEHVASCNACQRVVNAAMSDLGIEVTFPSHEFASGTEDLPRRSEEPEDPAYAPGTVVAGRYEVQRSLGRGGMGSVVAAVHLGLKQPVAIKFLRIDGADARARFLREGQILGQLRSPNVVRVYDSGTLDDHDETPFIVMEYLEGSDMSARIDAGPIGLDAAVRYTSQVCRALEAAHAAGIVHRDLKPSNLFLATQPDGSEVLKVLDFGVSKRLAADDSTLTTTGAVIGTPLYMSPEQLQGSHSVDHTSDIWSLGAILYELLTGRAPFNAGSINALLFAIVYQPPKSLRDLRPELPVDIERVVMRCLEKDVARRYRSVAEVRAALERCDSGKPRRPLRERPWVRYLGLVVATSLVAAVGLWLLSKPAAKVVVETPPPSAATDPSPPPPPREPAAPTPQVPMREPEPVLTKPAAAQPSKRAQRESLDIGEVLVR